jgi:D-arabinose 1-dehydrogenase-like Zn-dependent alcohol dehydrogenase
MTNTYRALQISKPGTWDLVTRDIPEPGQGQVLIKVEACGVCHSDVLCVEGHFPGVQYPRVPGHEVIGKIVKLGANVNEKFWKVGDRVGLGWHGGHCFNCEVYFLKN